MEIDFTFADKIYAVEINIYNEIKSKFGFFIYEIDIGFDEAIHLKNDIFAWTNNQIV